MNLRITLTDSLGATKVISEPGGWDSSSIGLERHPQLLSLIEYFKASFQTYGSNGTEDGGRDWILAREKTFGPDALIGVLVEIDPSDSLVFRTLYSGNLGIGLFVETLDQDHLLQIVFANSDFWSKIMARWQTEVDLKSVLDLDGNAVVATPSFILPLPSQKIPKSFKAIQKNNQFFSINPFGHPPSELILALSFDLVNISEIETYFNFGTATAKELISPLFNFDTGGTLKINNLKFTFSKEDSYTDANFPGTSIYFTQATADKLSSTIGDLELFIQINNQTPIPFSKSDRNVPATYLNNDGVLITNQETIVTDYSLTGFQKEVSKNDALKIYGVIQQDGTDAAKLASFCLWGNEGWSHRSIDESIYFQQGSETLVIGVSSFFRGGAKNGISPNEFNQLEWDASINLFPALESDGGAIKILDTWFISGSGNLGGVLVDDTYVITAKVNTPGQLLANWRISKKHIYEGLEAYGEGEADISFNSIFPDTTTEAFLTHDVIAGTIDRISGRPGLFYSEYFGNPWTSRVYAATGCGSLKGNMKGLHVRGYSLADKPYAKSAQDWFEGVNPIDCIGLGYEKRLGIDVIRCERAPYFFDDSSMNILFSNVQNIKRSYDSNWQFNSIDYGYEKWQSQAASGVGSPSGIDDPQSQGTRNTIFKIIGKKFKIMSKWLAASLAIETMRRLASLLSANYTYDDDVVVIYLHSNGDGTFTPELAENYSSITNLSNKETRYNTTISSTRNFLRWRTYLSGCLQPYPDSSFKFVPGQGNYIMTSTRTTICDGDETDEVVSENGDVAIGTDFLFIPMPFEIQHYMDFDDYETLVANKNLSIGISQTNVDHKPFFIDKLDYQIATGLVKCIAWPKIPFDIVVPDTGSSVEAGGFKYFEEPYHEKQFE